MGQAVFHNFPSVSVEYEFKCRNKNIDLRNLETLLRYELKYLCNLKFSEDELDYLSKISFLKSSFIEFLRNLKLNFEFVKIESKEELTITVIGPWAYTIWFEVPILAIVNELYFDELRKKTSEPIDYNGAEERLDDKIEIIKKNPSIIFSDFGTRRRFSRDWHNFVIKKLKNNLDSCSFVGTSNVMMAKNYELRPIGTMAHEWIMAMQSLTRLRESQKFAFDVWSKEYRGDLGIALSDTLGSNAFFNDFDLYFSKLFDGARHDSGNPKDWCEKLIEHYERKKIDPKTKVALFSDSLTFSLMKELNDEFGSKIMTRFGIGTNLTNDIPKQTPLNIVMKMTKCNGLPVAKISNVSGKTMCKDEDYVNELKRAFQGLIS
jgi:nicotinate phosphoribosyltransferase